MSLFFQTAFDYRRSACRNWKRGGQAPEAPSVSFINTVSNNQTWPQRQHRQPEILFRDWIKLFSLSSNYCQGELSLPSWTVKAFSLKVMAGEPDRVELVSMNISGCCCSHSSLWLGGSVLLSCSDSSGLCLLALIWTLIGFFNRGKSRHILLHINLWNKCEDLCLDTWTFISPTAQLNHPAPLTATHNHLKLTSLSFLTTLCDVFQNVCMLLIRGGRTQHWQTAWWCD